MPVKYFVPHCSIDQTFEVKKNKLFEKKKNETKNKKQQSSSLRGISFIFVDLMFSALIT